jgi:hypothetical protein
MARPFQAVPSRENHQLPAPSQPLKGGDGGGTFDGMEARVAALEAHMQHVREDIAGLRGDLKVVANDVGAIKIDMATLKGDFAMMRGDIARLPGKGWIVSAVGSLAALLIALSAIANFGPTILRLLRAH